MRVNSRRRLGAAIAAGACAVALGGCGSSGTHTGSGKHSPSTAGSSASPSPTSGSGSQAEEGKPAKQVLADSKSALFNAKAVHITGGMSSTAGAGVNLDMQFQGQDAEGTLTLGGIKVGIVKTQGKLFIKAPGSFWSKTAGSKASALNGKWIKVDAKSAPGLGSFSLQGIAASLNASGTPLNPKTTTGTVDGQPAIIVTQKDGSKLYVADSTTPVPLKIVSSSGGKKGTVRFTGYGSTRTIRPPAKALTPQQALKGGVSKT